mmetsp:Transcript_7190/g.13672  ORF Transcript_7190/g.13672 Transcript_7190/m.13672 type:complete len:369 (+) Transcript_7190:374-1480(+)
MPRKRSLIQAISFIVVQGWTTQECSAKPPLALHRVIEVERSAEVVIRLDGFDQDGDVTTAVITSLPAHGALYQVSQIYNQHGYDPKAGKLITNAPERVIGKRSRIVYKAPDAMYHIGEWGRFQYKVKDLEDESLEGIVVIVPPSKAIVASDFLLGDEDWSVIHNGPEGGTVTYERINRGIMSFYIFGTDKSVNIGRDGRDMDIWFFELPKKFLGWHGISYGGRLEFDLSSFSGDFSAESLNQVDNLNLVEIHCERCSLNSGEIYGFPLNATDGFFGRTKSFSLPLHESAGWLKDPKNTLFDWVVPTKCEMIEMLSGISSIRILGDFTGWYETVMIDNVKIVLDKADDKYQLPVCAQVQPDGRRCKCPY